MRRNHTSNRNFLLLPLAASLLLAAVPANAGSARCYMHGIITPKGAKKSSLSDMIRLHFDADDKKKCEEMMMAYCDYNIIEKGFSTERLKGSFKADVEKEEETTYTFTTKCKLEKTPADPE